KSTWLALSDGEPAGFGWLMVREPGRGEAGIRVVPRFRGRGLARRLVALSEGCARERGVGIMRQSATALDRDGRRLLEQLGYARPSPRSAAAASGASPSASTRRTRPGRRACTSGRGCRSTGRTTSTRRSSALPEPTVQPASRVPLEAAIGVVRAIEESLLGHSRSDERDLSEWWGRADLERDSWALQEDGRLLAFGWVEAHPGAASAAGFVNPEARGRGFGSDLVDRAESRAPGL